MVMKIWLIQYCFQELDNRQSKSCENGNSQSKSYECHISLCKLVKEEYRNVAALRKLASDFMSVERAAIMHFRQRTTYFSIKYGQKHKTIGTSRSLSLHLSQEDRQNNNNNNNLETMFHTQKTWILRIKF